MRFIATADSDIGISKATNQDSVLIKQAKVEKKFFLLLSAMAWVAYQKENSQVQR